MNHAYYKNISGDLENGCEISYVTAPGGYHPAHWHNEVEILYHLNGESMVTIENKTYRLAKKHMIVIDGGQVHSTYTKDLASMFISIHISREYMKRYVPEIDLLKLTCLPIGLMDERFKNYLDICLLLKKLTEIYIKDLPALELETQGLILQIFARLVRYFSTPLVDSKAEIHNTAQERVRKIVTYVTDHFHEPLSLDDAASQLGLGKEYFCRFFKKNMGKSFLQYVNEVRLSHIYHDLKHTDLPISEIMEENGFNNQKIFNREFKKIYGCRPSDVRRQEG